MMEVDAERLKAMREGPKSVDQMRAEDNAIAAQKFYTLHAAVSGVRDAMAEEWAALTHPERRPTDRDKGYKDALCTYHPDLTAALDAAPQGAPKYDPSLNANDASNRLLGYSLIELNKIISFAKVRGYGPTTPPPPAPVGIDPEDVRKVLVEINQDGPLKHQRVRDMLIGLIAAAGDQGPSVPVSVVDNWADEIKAHCDNMPKVGFDKTRFNDGARAGYGQAVIWLLDAAKCHRPVCAKPDAPTTGHHTLDEHGDPVTLTMTADKPDAPEPCTTEERVEWLLENQIHILGVRHTLDYLRGKYDDRVRAWLAARDQGAKDGAE